jgi:hypothetical protein
MFYRVYKNGNAVRTGLKEGDVIGFNTNRFSQEMKIFRPLKKSTVKLFFREEGCYVTSKELPLLLCKKGFEAIARLMAASANCKATEIPRGKLEGVCWIYQLI